jgi:hypothetical protein
MSTSGAGKSSVIASPTNGVPLTTIYAIPIDTATLTAAAPTTEANALPTSIIAAGGVPSTPTFTYSIPGASSPTGGTSSERSELSVGAKIGIGVGCGLLFISLIVGLFLFFKRRKQKLLAQRSKGPDRELGFSPAPTHTTFEKGKLDGRVDSRADTLHNYSIASRLDSSRSGTPGSGMVSKMESRSNSRLDQISRRNESRQTNRSGSPLHRRIPSRNSLYQGRITPNSNKYIAELATPTTPSDGYHNASPIHELGSEKGDIEIQHHRGDIESINDETDDPVVYEIVELPDTSRRSVKNWNRRTASMGSNTSRPTIRDVKDHRSIPVPPVPEDHEVFTSWLASASGSTTPTNSRFAS